MIRQATAEDRSQRLPSVADLRERVQALLASSTPAILVRPRRRHLLMVAGLGLALAVLVAWGVWFHFTSTRPAPEPAAVHPAAPAAGPSVSTGTPPPRLTTEDGARMRLVPGGEVRLPDGSKVAVAPFYLDETLVTNHQYVEFLNAMLPHLRVEGDRVKLGGEVLLRLGQVRGGVEPIVFRNGRFHLQDPSLAAHPVVRVTGFGAAAYAAHYGKQLPTLEQWLRAREGGAAVPSRVAPQDPMAAMHARMAAPVTPASREDYAPVTQSPPNRYGIRGLGGGDGGVAAGAGWPE